MVGMDPETGRLLSGLDRLRASIADILATPLGSRRERPDYSSRLPRMIDQPQTAGWIQAAQAEAGRAIKRWETSFAFERAGQRSRFQGQVGNGRRSGQGFAEHNCKDECVRGCRRRSGKRNLRRRPNAAILCR